MLLSRQSKFITTEPIMACVQFDRLLSSEDLFNMRPANILCVIHIIWFMLKKNLQNYLAVFLRLLKLLHNFRTTTEDKDYSQKLAVSSYKNQPRWVKVILF